MIHASALHGTSFLTYLGKILYNQLTTSQPEISSTFQLHLADDILSTALSLISTESRNRRMIGGSSLNSKSVLVFSSPNFDADSESERSKTKRGVMIGVMGIWAAGGVALLSSRPNDFSLIKEEQTNIRIDGMLVPKFKKDEMESIIQGWPNKKPWITEFQFEDSEDSGNGIEVEGYIKYSEWLRDLRISPTKDNDRALVLLQEDGSRKSLSHNEIQSLVLSELGEQPSVDDVLDALWAVLCQK